MLDLAAYVLVRLLSGLLAALPPRAALAVGRAAGQFAFRVVRIRRSVVLANLRHVLGGARTEAELLAIAAEAYRQFGMTLVDMLRGSGGGAEVAGGRVEIDQLDRLRAMAAAREPIIYCGPHFGSFDLAAYALAESGLHAHVVMKPMRSERVTRFVAGARERRGLRMVLGGRGLFPDLVALLRAGECVGVLPDQNARGRGVTVDFLGKPASLHRGAARLHLETGAPIVVCVMERRKDDPSSHHLHVIFVPPHAPTGDPEADTSAVTRRMADAMGGVILRAPEQYFWFHRLWGKDVAAGKGGTAAANHRGRAEGDDS